jgi:hypothetical protein
MIGRFTQAILQGPTKGGKLDTAITKVKRIDFQPAGSQSIDVEMATVTTSGGIEFQTPTSLLEVAERHLYGCCVYADELRLSTGVGIALSRVEQLEFEGGNLIIAVMGGTTIEGKLGDYYWGSPLIAGLTEFGPFSLKYTEVKKVDFHR